MYVINLLGFETHEVIGTKMKQAGCSSGKKIILNWAVTDKEGFYVIKVSSCGAWSEPFYYIISNWERYDLKVKIDSNSFKAFKSEYLSLIE